MLAILLILSLSKTVGAGGPMARNEMEQRCLDNCEYEQDCTVSDIADCRNYILCVYDALTFYYDATMQQCPLDQYHPVGTVPIANVDQRCQPDKPQNCTPGPDPKPGPGPGPDIDPPFSKEQRALNRKCVEQCATELCYLADDSDCRNFIMCERDARGRYMGTLKPCAFGTYWAGLQKQKKITCDLPKYVNCSINYCSGRQEGEKYDHKDKNCKTYWECTNKGPKPFCCKDGFRYDSATKNCTVDVLSTCHDPCPIKVDVCTKLGQRTEFLDDGNCRTYWNCEVLYPHPVCCKDGQAFDAERGECKNDNFCKDPCPPEYEPDKCLQAGVKRYDILDNHCRTYMQCDPQGDKRWCCRPGEFFNIQTQECDIVLPEIPLDCDDVCPLGYSEFCPLKQHPSDNSKYLEMINNFPLERPCAPGTEFDLSACTCGIKIKNPPDNTCNMELDVVFDLPMINRRGSQDHVEIIQHGNKYAGPEYNGSISFRFDGKLIFAVPFGQQQFDQIFFDATIQPQNRAKNRKQILISNCMNTDLGNPTFEVYLKGGDVVASIVTNDLVSLQGNKIVAKPLTISVPYKPREWQDVRVVYNGETVTLISTGSNWQELVSAPLKGRVPVAAEGLDIGGCTVWPENKKKPKGFKGSMAKLRFSKCLKQAWVDEYLGTTGLGGPQPRGDKKPKPP